jgi:CheY-like chemotaxis protein
VHQPSILLVEDQDAHARLVETVVKELEESVRPYRVATVDQALEFLLKTGKYVSVPEPGLVLLDLNLSCKSGYDVLAAILANTALKHICVVIFSSESSAEDKQRSLSLGAVAHVGKPWTYSAYVRVLRDIVQMIPKDGVD